MTQQELDGLGKGEGFAAKGEAKSKAAFDPYGVCAEPPTHIYD